MLLDMQRLSRAVDRRFPPHGGRPLISRMEHALVSYVRGQVTLSLIIGASAGLGLYILGATGLVPGADNYALLFGGWVALTEVLPYLGPWLGAIPPAIYALVVHPISAIWVVLLFLGIHQLEGHIVVPKVMGSVLRLHPLLVIFGLLAGSNIAGLRRRAARAAAARGRRARCGSSSPSGSCSSRGRAAARSRSRSSPAAEPRARGASPHRRRVTTYAVGDERVSGDAAPAAAAHGRPARPRARDDALARRPRDAALRRARGAAERGAAGHVAAHGRGRGAGVRGAAPARRPLGDPVRDPGGEGRRGLGRVDRGRASSSRRCGRCGRGSPSCCSSPTSACASTRRTATAACCATARSTTTRRSSCSRARPSRTSRRAPTSSARAT